MQRIRREKRLGALPDDYHEVLAWSVTEKPIRAIAAQILGVCSFAVFALVFFWLGRSLGKLPSQVAFGLSEIGAVFIGIVLTLALHELTHGLVMRIFGAKPKYGILWKGMMLYATTPGFAYHRNDYVVILLAPFVFITTLVALGMWFVQGTLWVALLALCGIFNASGAIGDLWITMIVLRYAPTAYICDERDGIRVFCRSPEEGGMRKPGAGGAGRSSSIVTAERGQDAIGGIHDRKRI